MADAVARLEGGTWALVCGSGMAAVSAAVVPLVSAGGRIVASDRLYGRTNQMFRDELARFGVRTDFVDVADLDAVAAALREPAAVVFVETVSNPLCRVSDLAELARLAKSAGAELVVDNTFASPVLCRPLELGATLVMESLTKIMGGHSDVTLGAVAGLDPALQAGAAKASAVWGLSGSPFDSWLALRGLETLHLRVEAACRNARALADWLAEQPGVTGVAYPGLAGHPDHATAGRVLRGGFGHMLAFELAGGRDAVNRFMRAAPGVPFAPSLGHTGTTCSYPAGTSHRYESPEARERQGITPGLVRLSAGCDEVGAVKGEMARGLAAARG